MFSMESFTDEPSSFTSSPRQTTLELPTSLDMGGLKRKRAFDTEESSLRSISSPCSASVGLSTPALSYSDSYYDNNETLRAQPHPLQRNISSDSRGSKRLHLAARPRANRHISIPSFDLASLPSITSPTNIIQACHICSRRPSTIQDLPAYNDCETCNKRTCFVCIRSCEGPRCNSHFASGPYTGGKKVCSKCCVEVGSEGTIWCNTCYLDDTDQIFNKGNKEQLQAESEGRVAEWLNRFSGPDEMDLASDIPELDQSFLRF